ncbi:phosphate ABC transporter permease PstA [Allorhodopirellula heiligendammensis]|uniref:Phosphate transport system permease protein PstA n=1 Tax=Allorhodopirellula heiligendammensis TaxID=2714739 RepID=A0A5C6C5M6_9BACT|nr:phosphate ABC transporter permease PstA [Allorhodopirellula heiligendammensis]TWU19940.1 Phosphate transport system permease protein PstA [Allorhodopirellula heiligendammensis]
MTSLPTTLYLHRRRDLLVTSVIWLAAGSVVTILGWILIDIGVRGLTHVSYAFLTEAVEDAGRAGGIGPILISTMLLLGVTLFIAIPLSLATAIELTEMIEQNSWFSRNLRRFLDVLAGVPSIVFGLFGNALFVITLELGYSILSGGLTLACMVLPLLVRTFEQAITAVPREYRFAAAALGLDRTATLFRVVLPAAAPGLMAGVVLSVGRALAETAALIFTAGYVARTPESLLDSGRSMSVHIYDMAMNVPGGGTQAYATACVLVAMLLAINGSTAILLRMAGLASRPGAGGQW